MFIVGFIVGVAVGGALIGELAHRKPEWFAQVVKVANKATEVVNDVVDKVKQ